MRLLKPTEIQKARERLGMSQDQFAATFHLSASTVRKWEQGQAKPSGAAAVLLWLLTKIPDEILKALKPAGRNPG
jgi:putative transcriptional regulator